jgi:hypothetical protein
LVPGGTMKLAWPSALEIGSTEATTTWMSAMPPLVIQVLVPLSTHSSVGLVVDGPGAHGADVGAGVGSDTQKAARAIFSGVPKHCGTHSAICSGVPLPKIPATPRVVPKMASPMPASPHAISSMTTARRFRWGRRNMLAMKSSEYSPIVAASSMIGHGVSSRSSHSWAAGRTTFSAKSWTHFWSWS